MPQRTRATLTILVTVAICSLLAWQQFNGGVPSHSFMARKDMPSISNWWGALTLPILAWFALGNVAERIARNATTERAALAGFIGGALFGLVLAVSYSLGYSQVPRVQVRVLPLFALAFPIYRAEYLLGFVLALSYTFGGVLPIVIGSVFALVAAALHLAPRWLLARFRTTG